MPNQSKWQRLSTEAVNPATRRIDRLAMPDLIGLMIADNRSVLEAVRRETPRIVVAAEILVNSLRKGGRLIFVGAGTSGRLGVLEAAEMPPTFGISNDVVRAVMAGGREAVHRAKEGVEDDQ